MTDNGDKKTKPARKVSVTAPTQINDLRSRTYLVPVVPPRPAALVGRVFGYLGLTVVWLAVLAVGLFATMLAFPGMLGSAVADGGLQASNMFGRSDAWLAVIALPLAAAIFGWLSVFVVLASFGTMLSAATLFVRSLRRDYRGERLSFSILTRDGEAVGPASTTLTGVALSLLPVRLTRWMKVITMIQFTGWIHNTFTLLMGAAWGVFYFFTVGWLFWPVEGAVMAVCAMISAVLLGLTAWIGWRYRFKFAEVTPSGWENTVYAHSWPRRPQKTKRSSS